VSTTLFVQFENYGSHLTAPFTTVNSNLCILLSGPVQTEFVVPLYKTGQDN